MMPEEQEILQRMELLEKSSGLPAIRDQAQAVATSMQDTIRYAAEENQRQQQALTFVLTEFSKAIEQMTAVLSAPKEVIRDEEGRVIGARTVLDSRQ